MARPAVKPTEREREPHLRDLFQVGKPIEISAPTMTGLHRIKVWMRPPNPDQTQDAIRRAGARQVRTKAVYRDKTSESYQLMVEEVAGFESRQDLLDFLMHTEDENLREQAYNEVLYGEWGSNWAASEKDGQEGLDYLGILEALYARRQEIEAHNQEAIEKIVAEDDEELRSVQVLYDQFQAEVEERQGELRQDKLTEFNRDTDDVLREKVLKVVIDIECRTAWLEEYQSWMLFYSCRRMTDKKQLYFDNPDEITELPNVVQAQLNAGYREVTRAGADLKESPSPESSLLSSGPSGVSEEDSQTSSQTA